MDTKQYRVIVYIDGFNLYYGLKETGWRRYYWLDLCKFSKALLKSNQDLVGVKYFSSRVSSPPGKRKRQCTFLEAVTATDRVSFYEGHFLEKEIACRACGNRFPKHEEKMTDVQIATQLLVDSFADAFDTAIVVSADSDLVPPIAAVRKRFPEKRIGVAFPPKRYSIDLVRTATFRIRTNESMFRRSQMPNPVLRADGFALHRPSEWS